MPDEKKCFVIMPITTPDSMMDKYRDGQRHFAHVYECLFEPSIKEAGYIPIPPKAEGSDLIHAGIIQNLESADLVLCDMSCLNPNVFFEFGIRTALNKPVCIVKDEFAKAVPFDTGILNHQEYNSKLESWEIRSESKRLVSHLTTSAKRSQGANTLWKYFGLRASAKAYEVGEGNEAKMDYITMQLETLNQRVNALTNRPSGDQISLGVRGTALDETVEDVMNTLPVALRPHSVSVHGRTRLLHLHLPPELSRDDRRRTVVIESFAKAFPGWSIEWDVRTDDSPPSPSTSDRLSA